MTDAFHPPSLTKPDIYRNKRIGLLGGTFNPPHRGHFYIAETALSAFELDCVWMMVTPQNPLKNHQAPSMNDRIALCNDMNTDARIVVSDIERQMNTYITYDSIRGIQNYFPDNEFLWIAGMDNAITFHTWNHWQDILNIIPVSHFNRQPATLKFDDCPLYHHAPQTNIIVDTPDRYPLIPKTNYWIVSSENIPISSTELRAEQK